MASRINTTTAFISEQATVSNTAIDLDTFGFTQAQIDEASRAFIFVNSGAVRIWWDGTSVPTVSDGVLIEVGAEIIGDNIRQLQLIRDGSTDSEVAIVLEK